MYDLSDFRRGLKVLVDGVPHEVSDFQHVKPGKGNQFTRCKLRNLLSGSNLERTFKSGEKFEVPDLVNKNMNFLYQDEAGYHFMDPNSFEQMMITNSDMTSAKDFLKEGIEVTIMLYNGRPIGVDLPNAVNLMIKETEPSIKGDRVNGATKAATLETGAVVQVPLHISEGDMIRVDTRDYAYIGRVND